MKKKFKLFVWILFILMFIQSCLFKSPEPIIVGIMLLMMSFLFFPWEDKIKVKLNIKNKLFMSLLIFVITCIFLHSKTISYYYVALSFLSSSLAWCLMILYKKKK